MINHNKGSSMGPDYLTAAAVKTGSALEKSGSATAVLSGGLGFTGWLAENHEWLAGLGVVVGIFVGVVGLGVNFYFQHRRLKILERSTPPE